MNRSPLLCVAEATRVASFPKLQCRRHTSCPVLPEIHLLSALHITLDVRGAGRNFGSVDNLCCHCVRCDSTCSVLLIWLTCADRSRDACATACERSSMSFVKHHHMHLSFAQSDLNSAVRCNNMNQFCESSYTRCCFVRDLFLAGFLCLLRAYDSGEHSIAVHSPQVLRGSVVKVKLAYFVQPAGQTYQACSLFSRQARAQMRWTSRQTFMHGIIPKLSCSTSADALLLSAGGSSRL